MHVMGKVNFYIATMVLCNFSLPSEEFDLLFFLED